MVVEFVLGNYVQGFPSLEDRDRPVAGGEKDAAIGGDGGSPIGLCVNAFFPIVFPCLGIKADPDPTLAAKVDQAVVDDGGGNVRCSFFNPPNFGLPAPADEAFCLGKVHTGNTPVLGRRGDDKVLVGDWGGNEAEGAVVFLFWVEVADAPEFLAGLWVVADRVVVAVGNDDIGVAVTYGRG